MNIEELCPYFSADPSAWQYPRPASVLPRALRRGLVGRLKTQMGNLGAASDSSPLQSPHRLGVGLRAYMAGDPVRAMSPRHWMLQDKLEVRTESSPARRHAILLLDLGSTIEYASTNQPKKGQTALALAAIIQMFWERWGRSLQVIGWNQSAPLLVGLQALKPKFPHLHSFFCLSDFLWPEDDLVRFSNQVKENAPRFCSTQMYAIRDIEEYSKTTTLGASNSRLIPQNKRVESSFLERPFCSGKGYVDNLMRHEDLIRHLFPRCSLVTPQTSLVEITQGLFTHGQYRK